MSKKIKIKSGTANIPDNWIILDNGILPANAVNIGIVEVRGMGDIPHFVFFMDNPDINMLTTDDCDRIVQLCNATYPGLMTVWENDKRLGNDCAHIGFFGIPVLDKSPILPYGHDCILIKNDNQQG